MIGVLPKAVTVAGVDYRVRSDYRDVLQVFEAFNDPELSRWEKGIVAIYLLLEPFTTPEDVLEAVGNGFDVGEAFEKIIWFITAGKGAGDKKELPVYDWVQDEQMIFSAVNKVAGKETREIEYLHWWTFLGYFNEIEDGNLTFIVGIRSKLNKRKKLEKHEKEFLDNNNKLVILERRTTREEIEKKARLNAILDRMIQ